MNQQTQSKPTLSKAKKFKPLLYKNLNGDTKSRNSSISAIIKKMDLVASGKLIPTNSLFKKMEIGILISADADPLNTFLRQATNKVNRIAAVHLIEMDIKGFDNEVIKELSIEFHSRLDTIKSILANPEVRIRIIESLPEEVLELHSKIDHAYHVMDITRESVYGEITSGEKVRDNVNELLFSIPKKYSRHYAAFKIVKNGCTSNSYNTVMKAYGFFTKLDRELRGVTSRQEADKRRNDKRPSGKDERIESDNVKLISEIES